MVTVLYALLGIALVQALWSLYSIDQGIRALRAELKQMKIDLIHDYRGALK